MRKKQQRTRLSVERLEPRLYMAFGALDANFGDNGLVRFENVQTADSNDQAYAVVAFPDGSIVMAGTSEVGKGTVSSFAKLDSAGQLVPSFGIDGRVMLPFAMTDTRAVAASDGNLYVSGSRFVDDVWRYVVIRLLSNGTVDSLFGGAGYRVFESTSAFRILPTPDAGVAVLTHVSTGSTNVPDDFRIRKLDASGQLDIHFGIDGVTESFDPYSPFAGPGSAVIDPVFFADDLGRILVVGSVYTSANQVHSLRVARFTPDGTLDTAFADQGLLRDSVVVGANIQVVAEEASGGAILVAWAVADSSSTTLRAKRLNADGSEDLSFGTGGLCESPAMPPSVYGRVFDTPMLASAGPGRTLVTLALQSTYYHYRYFSIVVGADGQFDPSHGDGGVGASDSLYYSHLTAVGTVIHPDGRIRIAAWGYDWRTVPPFDWYLFGLDAEGHAETAFGNNGISSIDFTQQSSNVRYFGVQSASTSLFALQSPDLGLRNPQSPDVGDAMVAVLRGAGDLNTDHASGGTFSLGGMSSEHSSAWSPLPDGGLLQADIGRYDNGVYPCSINKRFANGQFDPNFGQNGSFVILTNFAKSGFRPLLKQSATGQIYAAMQTVSVSGAGSALGTAWVAKASAAGQLDPSFANGGVYRINAETSELADFVTTKSGELFLLFSSDIYWPTPKLTVVKLNASGQVDTTFANQGSFSKTLPKSSQALKIALDKSGRLLVLYRSENELHVHRITGEGQADGSFADDGDLVLPLSTRSFETFAELVVFGNQPVVAATTGISSTDTTVYFLTADGSLDPNFGQSGVATYDFGEYGEQVRDLCVLVDGSVVLGMLTQDAINGFGQIVKLQGMTPSPVPLHNVYWPLNTTAPQDKMISPRDALLVINYLNADHSSTPASQDPAQVGYIDVNADRLVSPIDALLIINYLNRNTGALSSGEGESSADTAEATRRTRGDDLFWAAFAVFENPLFGKKKEAGLFWWQP